MKNFEKILFVIHHLKSSKIKFWRRYIDDIFIIFEGNETEAAELLTFINTLDPNLEFVIELANNNILTLFLDISINLTNEGFTFDVFRKPTATDISINYKSNHPFGAKFANFRFLLNRLFKMPLTGEAFITELNTIRHIGLVNDFPTKTINKFIGKFWYKLKYKFE